MTLDRRRHLFVVLTVCLGLTSAALYLNATPPAAASTVALERGVNRGPCDDDRYRVRPAMGHDTVETKVRHLIGCAVDRWSVDGALAKALSVAQCESRFWPWARGGSNSGVFQQRDAYWPTRARSLLEREWFHQLRDGDPATVPGALNARANVLVSIRMAHTGGWGAWACD